MSKTFTAACKDFFGFKDGQKLSEFAAELKALTPEDKQDIFEGFKAIGIECEPPQRAA